MRPGSVEVLVVPAVAFFFAGAIEGCFTCWNGGRRCWDLCFVEAQTGNMNSRKGGKESVELSNNSQKIQPFTLWREWAIYTPIPRPGFPKLPHSNPFTAHLQLE